MNYLSALSDFREARRRAALEQIIARLTGRSADLLPYEEVRAKLKARNVRWIGLQDVPLDAIVGSVGRYSDFTRSFLPKQDSDADRWARVQMAVTDLGGLPPIQVYQIGDAYFVQDGNHRVSVARQLGAPTIQAHVIEIETKVPLTPDIQPDDLILKAEYADFVERTHLDEVRPEADLSVTVPGQYQKLLEHIEVHRYFMGQEQQREIPYEEAAAHWYDQVYLPVVQVIRERGILRDFPGRTEADLYLWVSEHRADLEKALGWEMGLEDAAEDLAARFSRRPRRVAARLGERVRDAVTPDSLESGPAPGTWRRERESARRRDRLFANILVPVSGAEVGWNALEQAFEIARREGARLRGLYVVPSAAERDSERTRAVQAEFDRRCQAAGIVGNLAVEVGKIARKICERARWADLIVLKLSYPPAPQPAARWSSGFRMVVRRCATPVLAVPGTFSGQRRPLLAYDGRPKAQEALFVAAYLADRRQLPLVVVTVLGSHGVTPDTAAQARAYLERCGVQATLVQERGPVVEAILGAAEVYDSDLILMGGYSHSPAVEIMLGSVVDEVLRASRQPVLLCR